MKRVIMMVTTTLLTMLGACGNGGRLCAQADSNIDRYVALHEASRRTMDNAGYWSVSLSAGGSAYFGEFDMGFASGLGEWLSPIGKVTVARWFSSVWGVRFQADGGMLKNHVVRLQDPSTKGQFYYADGYLQAISNVMNWGSVKRSNRPVSILLIGGVGMAWTPSRRHIPTQFTPAAVLGGQLNIRMNDHWSLALEIDGTIVKDNFNSRIGGRRYEGWATGSVGLVYRFY